MTDLGHSRLLPGLLDGGPRKKAAKKAWDASLLSFRDLRVEADSHGAVHIVCDTRLTASHLSDHSVSSTSKVTEQVAQLSISHDGDYTIATVLATPCIQI